MLWPDFGLNAQKECKSGSVPDSSRGREPSDQKTLLGGTRTFVPTTNS